MQIGLGLFEEGMTVTAGGKDYRLTYPEEVWKGFEPKYAFAAELTFLITYTAPHATGDELVVYDFPRPACLDRYRSWAPLGAEEDRIERRFREDRPRPVFSCETSEERAVLALTMGKDSLSSLLIGREMGLDLVGVHCYHPSLSDDYEIRLPQMDALGSLLGMPVHVVSDDVKALSATGMPWSMAIATYCLMLLPFAHHYGARFLLVGNEFDFNYQPANTSPLQTLEGTLVLDEWIGELTDGSVRVTSLIHSLHTVACHKLVHGVRPDVGRHQVSCRRVSFRDDRRWCESCKTCAANYLFLTAMGQDPETVGFRGTMFDEKNSTNFSIFQDGLNAREPHRLHAAQQELLGFYLAEEGGGDTWMQRHVRQKHGALFGSHCKDLEGLYLAAVKEKNSLPMSARSTETAQRLLDAEPG